MLIALGGSGSLRTSRPLVFGPQADWMGAWHSTPGADASHWSNEVAIPHCGAVDLVDDARWRRDAGVHLVELESRQCGPSSRHGRRGADAGRWRGHRYVALAGVAVEKLKAKADARTAETARGWRSSIGWRGERRVGYCR